MGGAKEHHRHARQKGVLNGNEGDYWDSWGCQEAATELGRNEEEDVSRKRGKHGGVRERWEWEEEQQTKTPVPSWATPSSLPSNPHCWALNGGTAERDGHRRTVTSDCKSSSSWREQTKRWTKEGQRWGQTPYGGSMWNKTGMNTSWGASWQWS